MIDVCTVCVGPEFSDDYVIKLRNMVARNLTLEHRFWSLTDREIDGITTLKNEVHHFIVAWEFGFSGYHNFSF